MIQTTNEIKNGYCARQVSAMVKDRHYILSVLVKKTFTIGKNGKCTDAEEMLPLYNECVYYPDNDKLLQHDYDLFAFKPMTDVVIKGHARNKTATNKFLVQIQIGRQQTSIQVLGNRKAYLNAEKKIQFTNPEIVPEMPLRYDYAYGGCDIEAEKKIILPDPELIKLLPPGLDLFAKSLFRYQRNPLGKGFIVQNNSTSFDNLELPNLEDPSDLITPQNLLAGDENRWYEMPLPRCTDWVDTNFFPRLAYFGLVPLTQFFEQKPNQLKEIFNKWADADLLNNNVSKNNFSFRCTNGASLGLQLPFLQRGESVRLVNIHPQTADFSFELPAEFPKIWIDGRKGKLLETNPVIQTIVIEPDEHRLSIVWRGSGPALRPYHEEELKTMPFKVEWNNK
jgi:hypothetical protein